MLDFITVDMKLSFYAWFAIGSNCVASAPPLS